MHLRIVSNRYVSLPEVVQKQKRNKRTYKQQKIHIYQTKTITLSCDVTGHRPSKHYDLFRYSVRCSNSKKDMSTRFSYSITKESLLYTTGQVKIRSGCRKVFECARSNIKC